MGEDSGRAAAIRSMPAVEPGGGITLGNIELRLHERSVKIDGEAVALSAQEFALLAGLMARPGATIPYASLTAAIWGEDGPEQRRRLAVVACRLRGKLGRSRPYHIETQKKRGYRIVSAVQAGAGATS